MEETYRWHSQSSQSQSFISIQLKLRAFELSRFWNLTYLFIETSDIVQV